MKPQSKSKSRHGRQAGDRSPARSSPAEDGPTLVFGIHAVQAALDNPSRPIVGLWLTENAENRLADAVAKRAAVVTRVTPRDLDRRLGPDTVHQGALLETEPLPDLHIEDLAERAEGGRPIIVLDQVTDPHNVGAILRSAAVFGAAGLVMTRRHSPPLGGALAKSASGALDAVPIALVANLAQALALLKDRGFAVIGLDGTGETRFEDEPDFDRTALVLGAEGKGLRHLTRETCTRICRIHTDGPLASLNVSNAAAVALHHAALVRSRR